MKIQKGATPANFPELRGSLAGLRWPCFAEVKYDGEATLIGYKQNLIDDKAVQIFTSNKYGTSRTEWSKLDLIQDIMEDHDVVQAVFLAELYYGDGKQNALYELLKNKDSDGLNLAIYDLGYIKLDDGKEMKAEITPLIERKELLMQLFKDNPELTAKVHLVNDRKETSEYFTKIVTEGYEGIVVKPLDSVLKHGPCNWVKMKFKDRTVYQVADISTTQERIDIIVPNGNTGAVVGSTTILCGVKVTNKHKAHLSVGDMVEIEHQGVLDSGSLRHPVFIRKVTEGERSE